MLAMQASQVSKTGRSARRRFTTNTPLSQTIDSTFLTLYRREPLHAGLVILVPNVVPAQQRLLFQAALVHIGRREIVNAVLEVELRRTKIYCSEYVFPPEA